MYSRNLFWNTIIWKQFGPFQSFRTVLNLGLFLTSKTLFRTIVDASWGFWSGYMDKHYFWLCVSTKQALLPLIPWDSLSDFKQFSHRYMLICTQLNTWLDCLTDLQSSLSVNCILKTLAAFVPWTLWSVFSVQRVQ